MEKKNQNIIKNIQLSQIDVMDDFNVLADLATLRSWPIRFTRTVSSSLSL